MTQQGLNPLAIEVRDSLVVRHVDWTAYVDVLDGGDLEVAVPAPRGSRAGHLVVFTHQGEDRWIRLSPGNASYYAETDREMHAVIEALLSDDAFFVVVSYGDEWVETTLLRPGEEPVLHEGQVANVVSWSGRHDKVITYTEKRPSEKGA
jgi:hypothetical protein